LAWLEVDHDSLREQMFDTAHEGPMSLIFTHIVVSIVFVQELEDKGMRDAVLCPLFV
jgi:hypothetical protein